MITVIKNSKKRSLSDYPYYILKTSQQKQYPFRTRHSSNERNYLIMIFRFLLLYYDNDNRSNLDSSSLHPPKSVNQANSLNGACRVNSHFSYLYYL